MNVYKGLDEGLLVAHRTARERMDALDDLVEGQRWILFSQELGQGITRCAVACNVLGLR